ncbi:TOMM precursor leader peptide-binding protein [Streptomyces sp. HPF1205]|uniref:TOMM precursor leader peptide-binding protein n=1 Tax=Streptomyces sp. HPF1205 TaxID=2873262 RepID=UPI001CEC818D|nr:TOMM precursor leader peptide-binding protein [Streptomyces sp. HPF1205]
MSTELRDRPPAAAAVADPPAPGLAAAVESALASALAGLTARPPRAAGGPGTVPPGTDPVVGSPGTDLVVGSPGTDLVVASLGLRDELAAGPDARPAGVHVYGHHVLVGPFGSGGRPACARCLVRRWQAVRTRALREALERGAATAPAGVPPWAVPFVTDALAAVIAAQRAAERAPAEEGPATGSRFPYAFLVDAETLAVTRFAVVPDAECPACGDLPADSATNARVLLESSPKREPGGFRSRPADDYDVPLEAFVNPAAGMLGPSVVPDLVSGSTSSAVGSFFLRSGDYLRECFWGGHTPRYRSSVRVGLLEGLERFAGMRPRGRRTTVTAAYDDIRDQALDPRECGLYPREFHLAEPGVRPFDPARPIPWVRGWSLRDERPLLVPEIIAYYHAPGGLANRFVQESSNGCASGGTLAEAVYFGLMEVIERDAFLLAWYGRAPLVEIDATASRRPGTRAMIDRLAMYGYRARFFDTRVTFPVPVVTAVAEREDGGLGRLCFGAGASLDPEAALEAGLCEIATDAVNLRRRTVRDLPRLRAMAADFSRVSVLHDHPLLYGLPEMAGYADFLLRQDRPPLLTPAALARDTVRPGGDTRDDVVACVRAVTRAGFDVIVVDQTTPEQRRLGFHTAGVIVPGLLPIDFGWSRQRAPHMPRTRRALAEAGLRPGELGPADLNPAPHPFP